MTSLNASSGPSRSRASVRTSDGSRYLQQLCKHFGHKVEATFDDDVGKVIFSIGQCEMQADRDRLHLTVVANEPQSLLAMKDVIERHLLRFAFREQLKISWNDGLVPHEIANSS